MDFLDLNKGYKLEKKDVFGEELFFIIWELLLKINQIPLIVSSYIFMIKSKS